MAHRDPPRDLDGVERRPDLPRPVAALIALTVALLSGFTAWLLLGPTEFLPVRDALLYCALLVPPIMIFAARAATATTTRLSWVLFALACTVWLIAELDYFTGSDPEGPGSLWSQLLFLTVSPTMYVAIAVLIRPVMGSAAGTTYLDGLIIALAAAAALSLLAPAVEVEESAWELVIPWLYPLLDLLQVAIVAAVLAVMRRAAGPAWWLLLAGSVLIWLGDAFWLFGVAQTEQGVGAIIDLTWPLGLLLLSLSAWTRLGQAPSDSRMNWVAPVVVTTAMFALIVYATEHNVPSVTVALATATVLAGALRSLGAFRAATARARAQLQARTDDLTGLVNRRGLNRLAGQGIDSPRALLLVDVDRFKQINDTLGHQAGDEVLQTVAQRFRSAVDPSVVISRIGGDEFALLTPAGTGITQALELAAALHSSVTDPVAASGMDLKVELSIGIAVAPDQGDSLSNLLLAADRAMYRAKGEHVNTQVFDSRRDGTDQGRLLIMQDLRGGVDRQEFVCHYQPQLDVVTNEIVAVEALVRWQHPQRGVIQAADFLPVLEQTALIRPLTDMILNQSLCQLRAWDQQGIHLRMCANISATNLLDRALPPRVAQLLADHHIPAHRLTLEITETALSGDEERVRIVLAQLHAIGVQISIDDYGAGYSSLHQIGTMDAQELKLDREFVTGVGSRAELRSILSATVHLAHGLRLRMVAEGVESASDLEHVRLSGCDLAQGFHISAPLDGDSMVVWLQERSQRTGDERLRY
ncbi:MAG: bifunctional diguanylate cyclase/phosphodiesterase [Candidatus Nanopelagicales bacterium]